MGKKKFIPTVALIIILIGSVSSIYVYATQANDSTISINGQQYTIDQLFFITEPQTFNSLNFSGVALDDLVIKTGVGCLECHEYTLIGADGYQKTVNWENMQNGLLTHEKMIVFSDLPKAFRIKDIVKIEVI